MFRPLLHILLAVSYGSVVMAQTTNTGNNDPISPLINFLEQLQRLRSLYRPRETSNDSFVNNILSLPRPSLASLTSNSNSFQPITDNSITSNNNNNNNNNNENNNNRGPFGTRFVVQLPSEFGLGRPRGPEDNQRVTTALTDFLQGVRMASLERILRGTFGFTRNDNVRSVADTVIRNLFARNSATGTGQQRRGFFAGLRSAVNNNGNNNAV